MQQNTLFENPGTERYVQQGPLLVPEATAAAQRESVAPVRAKKRAESTEAAWDVGGLRPYQIEAIACVEKEIRGGVKSTLVVAATGLGKCLGRGTPVLMFDGRIKSVEDVQVGDLLMGPDSLPRKVLSLSKGIGPLYLVKQKKGNDYIVNEAHVLSLMLTNTGKPTAQYGAVVNISVPEYLSTNKHFKHLSKGYKVGVDWAEKPVALHPYFLGLWLGDGTARSPSITTGDEEVEIFLDAYAEVMGTRTFRNGEKPGCRTIHLSERRTGVPRARQNPVTKGLRQYGLVSNKHIPLAYLANSRRTRLDLLAGLIDSDGSHIDGCYDVIFKIKRLAEETCWLARSLGLACKIMQCKKTCSTTGKTGTYYRMFISGDTSQIPVRIPHKKAAPRRQKKNHLVCGISVEPIAGVGEYFGFETDGDHLFLLGDFTVTHNSTCMAKLAERFYRMWNHGVLILVHRRELIKQLHHELRIRAGIGGLVEMAEHSAQDDFGITSKIVIGSVATMRGERLAQWHPRDFRIVIVDESHHAVSSSYLKVFGHFKDARIVGFTATADRADGKNLGSLFDTVAYEYNLADAVRDGWLTRIEAFPITTDPPIDLSRLAPNSADYSDAELDAVIQAHLGSMVIAIKDNNALEDRRTIAFAPWVRSAKALSDGLNDKGIAANWICGDPRLCPERDAITQAHKDGKFQVLVNVGCLTEGYNDPQVSCVLIARPTKSRSLFAQMAGRATRCYPSPENNTKVSARIVDFAYLTGKHKLVVPTDLYDDSETDDEVMELAREIVEEQREKGEAADVAEAVEKAKTIFVEREKIRIRQRVVRSRVMVFDPLAVREVLGIKNKFQEGRWNGGGPLATEAQKRYLQNRKIACAPNITRAEASHIIGTLETRRKFNLATHKQVAYAIDLGCDPGLARRMTFKQAGEWISAKKG